MIRTVEQLDIVHERMVVFLADKLVELGRASSASISPTFFVAFAWPSPLESDHATASAVEHAAEIPTAADRPVHGVRTDTPTRSRSLP